MDSGQSKDTDSQFISFHDFSSISHAGNSEGQLGTGTSAHQPFNDLSNDSVDIGIIEDLQGMPAKTEDTAQHNFWTIEYYQKFFNVNTNDILEKLKRSMIPHRSDYLLTHIKPNPDLYGPFWISVTLVFAIAISENMVNYLQTASSNKYHWRYNFHIVTYAATIIFLYAWIVPLGLWGTLKLTNRYSAEEVIGYYVPGLLELLCLYGYSLSIYIPVVFLWIIQINWLQWSLVILVTFLSGGILIRSLLPILVGGHRIILCGFTIFLMQLLLTTVLMLHFFYTSSKTISVNMTELITSSTQASVLHKVIQNNSSNVSPTTF
ncbi:PREDICTED: protein YIPF1 [Cyphomyrmex costatus]|uniref:Protein YIPF1 n=1 Tax=Cyphomyrmex costatus TaxID=456900 RepID=A0A151IGW0_9HYME|nr:PREDICTED: protein YIPF1 [Cyphomyrmex costatus]KYN00668.1 Protein YIPF1 [Cyphomyrmex costatus]